MKSRFASMTAEQLRTVVDDYAARFPGWSKLRDGTGIARVGGPISQVIWFQKMNYSAYRPTHVVRSVVFEIPRAMHQILDVKNRETEYRLHAQKISDVISAMEQQFRPNIRAPLDVAEVLRLCELEARPDAANDLAMLAILHAWLGQSEQALAACRHMSECQLRSPASVPAWGEAMQAFGGELAAAVERNLGRSFLEERIAKAR